VTCPFERYTIKSDKEKDMKKTLTPTGSNRDRLGSAESLTTSNSGNKASSASTSLNIDVKIDWFVKTVREMKDETAYKKEI